jgi:tRNA U54 and U55 pseudouridine synthase Pus10
VEVPGLQTLKNAIEQATPAKVLKKSATGIRIKRIQSNEYWA